MKLSSILAIWVLSTSFLFAQEPSYNVGAKSGYGAVYSTTLNGEPVQILDMLISVQKDLTPQEKLDLEGGLRNWANATYEQSNGGVFLGNLRIFDNAVNWDQANVQIATCQAGARAYVGGFLSGGVLQMSLASECQSKTPSVSGDFSTLYSNEVMKQESYEFASGNADNFAATMAHEGMHYIFGIRDEYSSAMMGISDVEYGGFDNSTTVTVQNGDLYFEAQSDGAWKQLKIWASAYEYGTPFHFSIGTGYVGSAPPPAIDENWNSSSHIYYIQSKSTNEKQRSLTMRVMDQSDQRMVFTGPGQNWYMNWHGVSSVPFSISWGTGGNGVSVPGFRRYHRWNLSTEYNANPHNPQGRAYRKLDGTSCSGWDVISGNCPDAILVVPIPADNRTDFSYSLKNRIPTAQDEYSARDNLCALGANTHVRWNQALRIGDGVNKPDNSFIVGWNACRNDGGPLGDYTIPFMRVELDQPNAVQQAQQFIQIHWLDDVKTEVQVVIDYSGSMRGDKIVDARNAAKLMASAHSLGGLDNLGLTYFNVKVYNNDRLTYDQFKTIANKLKSPEDHTALYDALNKAISQFTSGANTEKRIYLLSDGQDNESTTTLEAVTQQLAAKNIRVSTFAIGANADRDVLAKLAELTGGDYRGTFSITSVTYASQLIANAYVAPTMGYSQIADQTISAGAQGSFVVTDKDQKFLLTVFGENLNTSSIELTDPQGRVVQAIVSTIEDGATDILRIQVPDLLVNVRPGYWHIQNKSASPILVQGMRYDAGQSTASMTMTVGPKNIMEYPNPVRIQARLRMTSPLTDLKVNGYIETPTGDTVHIVMKDDGTDGDAQAQDGLYTYIYSSYSQNGHYTATVNMDNENQLARTTMVGVSGYQGPMLGQVYTGPLAYSQSRGFEIRNVKVDDFNALPNSIASLQVGQSALQGRIDFAGDLDDFLAPALDFTSNMHVRVESNQAGTLSILGSDGIRVIRQVSLVKGRNDIDISTWERQSNMVLRVEGDVGMSYAVTAALVGASTLEVGRFENGSGWSASGATLDSINSYEGKGSLVSTAWGWREVMSRPVMTSEIARVSNRLSLQAWVPANPSNPYWVGTVGLKVLIPSSHSTFDLGARELKNQIFGAYCPLYFDVPAALLEKLAEPHPDVRFVVVMNGEPGIRFDDLRFDGVTKANEIPVSVVVCPDAGCSAENPLPFSELNGSRSIRAMGELYMDITGIPQSWTPNHLVVGISSEDGAPLTGSLTLDGQEMSLNDYYQKMQRPFVSQSVAHLKLVNYSGRPYRISWWFE